MIKDYKDLPFTLTVEQVGELLGISRKTAYALVKRKGFPAIKIGGKRIVVPRDLFIQWINEKCKSS